jgi:hypothetical protein
MLKPVILSWKIDVFFFNPEAKECGRVVHGRDMDIFIFRLSVVVLELSVPAPHSKPAHTSRVDVLQLVLDHKIMVKKLG